MKIILHTGVHCTDEDRLLKTLLRNSDMWRHGGIAIPGPSRYRMILTEVVNRLTTSTADKHARDVLLDMILNTDPERTRRLILSHPHFFSVPKLALSGGLLYQWAEKRFVAFCDLFDADEVELFIGLRNPATYLPALLQEYPQDLHTLLDGADPMHLRWSDLIRRLRYAAPEVQITVWANEDTPFIWGELARRMAGIPLDRKITGAFDMFSRIVQPEGMQRFRAFLHENPTISEAQKRRAMMVLLDKFALEDEVEEELDVAGWDDVYIDMLTELYEDDLEEIAKIEDVTMIRP